MVIQSHGRFLTIVPLLLGAAAARSQEPPATPAPELTSAEKQFQEMLNNVTLTGYFTVGDSAETHEDRYVIERVTKVKDELWKFDARIQYLSLIHISEPT